MTKIALVPYFVKRFQMQDAPELLLLLPKIRPPRFSSNMVLRPRLIRHVRAIEAVRLTVVSAPSGFGKTTIGAAWAHELKNKSAVVSWLSLCTEDNDPSRFFKYFAFAVNHSLKGHSTEYLACHGTIQFLLKGNQLISSLINNIAKDGSEFFLFLDNFQSIADQSIKDSLQFLIRNAPANFHLIVLSHPSGVADFLRRKRGTELRLNANDLRFTEAETKELFNAYGRRNDQAILAHSATGGWAAALHTLAAFNIVSNTTSANDMANLLNDDYLGGLLNTVLAGLTPDEVTLIEMTCITGRMCSLLFSALTGILQPRDIIHSVENTYGLISRAPEDGRWWSCYELIREWVMSRLSDTHPATIADIGNRASQWYAEQEDWAEAVGQALAVGNQELALLIIERCAAKLLSKGDFLTLIGWEHRIKLSSNPFTSVKTLMALALACALEADHDHNANLNNLIDAIEIRMRRELPSYAIEKVHWHLQGTRAILACRNDDSESALNLSVECLSQLAIFPSLKELVRCTAAYSYLQSRQWENFYDVLTDLTDVSKTVTASDDFNFLANLYRQILLGLASIMEMNFIRALRYLEEVNRQAQRTLGPNSLPGALSAGLLAFIYCERLEIEKAESLLNGVFNLVSKSGYVDCICRTLAAQFRIALLRHENEYALELLEKWERTASDAQGVRLQVICAYEKVCFFLRESGYVRAKVSLTQVQHLYALAISDNKTPSTELKSFAKLAQGQYVMATGLLSEAKTCFEAIYKDAVGDGDAYMILLSVTALALAEFKLNDNEKAFWYLREALTLAQAAALKASILHQPGNIWPLLEMYQNVGIDHAKSVDHENFIDELKKARHQNFNTAPVNLSPREESVLRLIALDKSNKEISTVLKITPETVKTHLKNIFIKLNVTKRNAAVRRANAIRLL